MVARSRGGPARRRARRPAQRIVALGRRARDRRAAVLRQRRAGSQGEHAARRRRRRRVRDRPGGARSRSSPQAIPLEIVYEDDDVIVVEQAGRHGHPSRARIARRHARQRAARARTASARRPAAPGTRAPARSRYVRPARRRENARSAAQARASRCSGATSRASISASSPASRTSRAARSTVRSARDPRPPHEVRDPHRRQAGGHALRPCASRSCARANCTFTLETGRTHQIRVHLAALGHPIINDPVYGRKDARVALAGQALHAWRLAFRHPVTREDLAFEVAAARRLRRRQGGAAPAVMRSAAHSRCTPSAVGAARDARARARHGGNAGLHAGRHGGDRQRRSRRPICTRSARRSSSPTPITCGCGPGSRRSSRRAACTASWPGIGRSSPTAAAFKSSAWSRAARSTTTA